MNIICTGDLMLESLIRLPAIPPENTTLLLKDHKVGLGGSAFNIFWHFFHFGRNAHLVGAAGVQDYKFVKSFFPSGSGHLIKLKMVPGQTDRLYSFVTPGAHRSVYCLANVQTKTGASIAKQCVNSEVLVMAGTRHANLRKQLANAAKHFRGRFLCFNPSYSVFEYSAEDLIPVLAAADLVCLNSQEERHVRLVLKIHSTRALKKLIKGMLIVTRSFHGLEVHGDSGKQKFPIVKRVHTNAIGAGDVFLAAFLDCFLDGGPSDVAAKIGLKSAQLLAASGCVRPIIRRQRAIR